MTEPVGEPVRELVVCSLEAWDDVWRRNQHLVSRLLAADEDLRVVFVEPPSDPSHALARRARPRRGRGLRRGVLPGASTPVVAVPADQVAPSPTRPVGGRAADVRRPRGRSGDAGLTRPVLWINDPSSAEPAAPHGLAGALRHHRRLARSPTGHHGSTRGWPRDEAYLLRNCHHVVVCSPRLLATKHADRVTLIPNAVDIDAYAARRPGPTTCLPDGSCCTSARCTATGSTSTCASPWPRA